MSTRTHAKKLLLEGRGDKRVIPFLIEANGILWNDQSNQPYVHIDEFDGISNLLKPGVIESELKASGIKHLGIIVDANSNAQSRFSNVRKQCIAEFPNLPTALPVDGLVETNGAGKTIGIWLMPDNQSRGMLETFLMFLAPNANDAIVQYARTVCDEARKLGAPFTSSHDDKARIHTWLAWQDEPGKQLHEAVRDRVLSPDGAYAASFVRWFRNVFSM